MHTILITGANRGIGLELTKQYCENGWLVHACYRSTNTAQNLLELAEKSNDNIVLHQLDVTNSENIQQLAHTLGTEPLDILFNNAGVFGPKHTSFGSITSVPWIEALKINTIAPLLISQALANNVSASDYKLIVNMSSLMGSIEDNKSGGAYIYRSSKTALNSITKSMAIDLKPNGIKVIALHPGWVKTDMGGPDAPLERIESVHAIFKLLTNINSEDSGIFFAYNGNKLPW